VPSAILCYTQTATTEANNLYPWATTGAAAGYSETAMWSRTAGNGVAYWSVTCLNCGFPYTYAVAPQAYLRTASGNASLVMADAHDLTFELPIAGGVPTANYTFNILGGVYVSPRGAGLCAQR
jgi:hypothetical protein